jgi:D-3-phosphoglycerate dehydrogenase
MYQKILIIDEFEPTLMRKLREWSIPFEYAPYMDRKELLKCISGYTGLVLRSKTKIDKEVINLGKALRFVARGGSGMDGVDEMYAKKRGVECINAPEGNRNAVAEHAMALLLNLTCNISKGNSEVNSGIWDREGNRGIELYGKKVGIIGYGNTGSFFAEKLSSFGVTVMAYDKYKKGFGSNKVLEVSMKEIYEHSDILSLHVPLTTETIHLVNKDFLNKFKKDLILLNTCRGKVVQLSSVLEALNSGKISRFGTDVLENEKLDSYSAEESRVLESLKTLENVIITPHIAGWSKESYIGISTVLADKIKILTDKGDFFEDEILKYLKN